jgi:hypothetical protein
MKRLMTLATMFGLTLSLTLSTASPARCEALVSSIFDSGNNEGWEIHVITDIVTGSYQYVASGGVTGGYITAIDANAGGSWWYRAPTKFYGDRSNAYGGYIYFFRRTHLINENGCNNHPYYEDPEMADVVLQSDSVNPLTGQQLPQLHYYLTNNQPTVDAWQAVTVPLRETGWFTPDKKRVSKITFQRVLANLTKLYIRGAYYECKDQTDLDNVTLNSPGIAKATSGKSSRRVRRRP